MLPTGHLKRLNQRKNKSFCFFEKQISGFSSQVIQSSVESIEIGLIVKFVDYQDSFQTVQVNQ